MLVSMARAASFLLPVTLIPDRDRSVKRDALLARVEAHNLGKDVELVSA